MIPLSAIVLPLAISNGRITDMEKYIYDESNGLWYELQGDYYIPCLTLPEIEI